MKLIMKISLFAAVFACQFLIVFAQTPTNTKGKIVKWEAINSEKNEFILFMPEGYLTAGNRDFYIGSRRSTMAHVSKKLILARYINGVVLIMEYYEGDAKQIQKRLVEAEKLTLDKEQEINGFQVKHISGKLENRPAKIQHFQFKNRLYVIKAISNSENNRIVKIFFESVRLVNQTGTTAAPNVPAGTDSTTLARIVEREPVLVGDAEAIPTSEADRQPIILKAGSPKFTFEMRRALGANKLKMKVLYSSSGKVTKVEILQSPSKLMERAAVEAAKETIFIPAEKDGKLVSVYEIIERSYGTGMLGF